jgi:hypothetical protein
MFFHVPALPFVVILLGGETLLGFQVEDGKVPQFLARLFKSNAGPKRPLTH